MDQALPQVLCIHDLLTLQHAHEEELMACVTDADSEAGVTGLAEGHAELLSGWSQYLNPGRFVHHRGFLT